jgi:hypothetical protein
LASPGSILDFALSRSLAFRLSAGSHRGQPVIPFNGPHKGFQAPLKLPIVDHFAAKGNPIGQDMDVLMVGVGVAGDDILVVRKTQAV